MTGFKVDNVSSFDVFNCTVSAARLTWHQMMGLFVSDEFETMWKEVTYFKALPRCLPVETRKKRLYGRSVGKI